MDGLMIDGVPSMKKSGRPGAGPIVFLPTAPYSSSNENGVRSTASATSGEATQSEERERAGSGDGEHIGAEDDFCTSA